MRLRWWWRKQNSRGHSLLELIVALGLLAMVTASLFPLQQWVMQTGISELKHNTYDQYLEAAYQRLRLYLYDAIKVEILENPHRLQIQRQSSQGIRQYTYYINPSNYAFTEHAVYLRWDGVGSQPGSYTTPIASEFGYFRASLIPASPGAVVHVSFGSREDEIQRELYIYVRNAAN